MSDASVCPGFLLEGTFWQEEGFRSQGEEGKQANIFYDVIIMKLLRPEDVIIHIYNFKSISLINIVVNGTSKIWPAMHKKVWNIIFKREEEFNPYNASQYSIEKS